MVHLLALPHTVCDSSLPECGVCVTLESLVEDAVLSVSIMKNQFYFRLPWPYCSIPAVAQTLRAACVWSELAFNFLSPFGSLKCDFS